MRVNGLLQSLMKIGPARLFAAFGLTAALAALLFGLIGFMGGERKALLFSDLDPAEAGRIVERLDQANIKYDLRGDGTSIFVSRAKVASARLMLAADGLPIRGGVGYELFDTTSALGQTQFMQDINRLRALEGELARTIISLDAVSSARVHLVLPERKLFERDKQHPTASIVLKLVGGTLSPEQIRAVRNLVAGAVPDLTPEKVTVLDESGKLLAAAEADGAIAAAGVADERKNAFEERIRATVLDLVEGIVGSGGARVQVSADMDFNRVTEASEKYDPDGRVVRSTNSVEDKSSEADRAGGPASASGNLPDGSASDGGAAGAGSERTEETVNYEISRTTRTETIEGGRLKRLSVAVAVDGVTTPGASGQPPQWAARDPAEIARITQLVRSAVGFNAERGDSVEVVGVRLARADIAGSQASDPKGFSLAGFDPLRAGEIGAALIAALALIIFVLRPLVTGGGAPKAMKAPKKGGEPPMLAPPTSMLAPEGLDEMMAQQHHHEAMVDAGVDIAQISGTVRASSVRKVADVVQAYPEQSATIVREWLAASR